MRVESSSAGDRISSFPDFIKIYECNLDVATALLTFKQQDARGTHSLTSTLTSPMAHRSRFSLEETCLTIDHVEPSSRLLTRAFVRLVWVVLVWVVCRPDLSGREGGRARYIAGEDVLADDL